MKLYHGTILEHANNIIKNGIITRYDEAIRGTDFGVGFYTTNYEKLAIKTARTKSFYHQDDEMDCTPVVLTLKYDIKCNRGYHIKTFNSCNDEWKKFVCANRYLPVRNNNDVDYNSDEKYDLVIGAVADSNMSDIHTALRKNDYILNDTILGAMIPLKIDNYSPIQYSFHNQELASCITVLGYDIIPIGRS